MVKLPLPQQTYLKKQVDPDGILIAPQYDDAIHSAPLHPPVAVEFDEIDMTVVLNWFLLEELDILIFGTV